MTTQHESQDLSPYVVVRNSGIFHRWMVQHKYLKDIIRKGSFEECTKVARTLNYQMSLVLINNAITECAVSESSLDSEIRLAADAAASGIRNGDFTSARLDFKECANNHVAVELRVTPKIPVTSINLTGVISRADKDPE